MSTLAEYKEALVSVDDEEIQAVIMDRAAEDFDLTLTEFLQLIEYVNHLFP